MRALAAAVAVVMLGAMGGAPDTPPPFFDEVRQEPVDATPPPPVLGDFDRAVQDLCGGWGDSVEETEFLALLSRFPHERRTILDVGGVENEEKLAKIWFKDDGFRHVLCGEPGGRTLGGMHWYGRYAQAQDQGWAGVAPACDRQEIAPPVYTLGIRYRRPDGTWGTKCPGGYAYSEGALDILAEVTAEAAKVTRAGRVVCIGRGRYPGGDFPMVVVVHDGGLVTAYPDVSPPDRRACGD